MCLAGVAGHFIRCRSIRGTRVQDALHDVAGNIFQALDRGGLYNAGGGGAERGKGHILYVRDSDEV